MVKILLEAGSNPNKMDKKTQRTSIHFGSSYGHYELTKLLVEYGGDVNIRSTKGQTPLFLASNVNCIELVKYFLQVGANINVQDGKIISGLL